MPGPTTKIWLVRINLTEYHVLARTWKEAVKAADKLLKAELDEFDDPRITALEQLYHLDG